MVVEITCCKCGHTGKVWVEDIEEVIAPTCTECRTRYQGYDTNFA